MIGSENTSGWMTASHSLLYLQHFINQVKPSKKSPVLLKIDDQISRYTIELLHLAKNNRVVLLTVPPHTSHKLQPLERIVERMGRLKIYYNQEPVGFMNAHK
jgi:hypothetical protein